MRTQRLTIIKIAIIRIASNTNHNSYEKIYFDNEITSYVYILYGHRRVMHSMLLTTCLSVH